MIGWLEQLTALPSVAGHEDAVIAWVRRWVARRDDLRLASDPGGNLVITQKRRSRRVPVWITAHMDHPGFVLKDDLGNGRFAYEFRGGVLDAYFVGSRVHLFGKDGRRAGRVESLERSGRYRHGVLKLARSGATVRPGDIGRWAFPAAQLGIRSGRLHAPACDDLAGVAAALTALDRLRNVEGAGHAGVLLTRAEEVGFVGAIAAATDGTIAPETRLICVEMSRSFAESPIGGGPIVRVGDASSVFSPWLTAVMAQAGRDLADRSSTFKFQRKLMAGGSCEATAFSAYGYESTCLCLALGNYHNMGDLSGVEAGTSPAKVAPEVISVDDYRGLVKLLVRSVGLVEPGKNVLRSDLQAHYLSLREMLSP